MVEALQRDYHSASISEQDRTMLDYVVKLTKTPARFRRPIMTSSGRLASTIAASCRSR